MSAAEESVAVAVAAAATERTWQQEGRRRRRRRVDFSASMVWRMLLLYLVMVAGLVMATLVDSTSSDAEVDDSMTGATEDANDVPAVDEMEASSSSSSFVFNSELVSAFNFAVTEKREEDEVEVGWSGKDVLMKKEPEQPEIVFPVPNEKEEKITTTTKHDSDDDWSSPLFGLPFKNGIYVMKSLQHFHSTVQALNQRAAESSSSETYVWVAFLEDEECPHSATLLPIVEGAAQQLRRDQQQQQQQHRDLPIVYVGRVRLQESDKTLLIQRFGISATPSLALVSSDAVASYLVEYTGLMSTVTDLVEGIQHYFDTLTLRAQPKTVPKPTTSSAQQPHPLLTFQPRQFTSRVEMCSFLRNYAGRLLRNQKRILPVLPSYQSASEKHYVQWLFADEPSDENFVLLMVQCRKEQTEQQTHYDDFDKMARAMLSRRDRLFLVLQSPEDCTEDGSVDVWEIPTMGRDFDETALDGWDRLAHYRYSPQQTTIGESVVPSTSRLVEFLVKVCTDSVLWFDRQTIAPIAFPKYRKVHAVLFIDMHHEVMSVVESINESEKAHDGDTTNLRSLDDHALSVTMKEAVRAFHHVCRNNRIQQQAATTNHHHHHPLAILDRDMVCLVVPSTETRILTTFGIDIWSPIDQEVVEATTTRHHDADASCKIKLKTNPVLPSLLITEQRSGGTRRHYKDFDFDYDTKTVMEEFVTAFWKGELPHKVKSSKRGARTNQAGVRIITADTIESELFLAAASAPWLDESNRLHSLILFTAASCGHCKRFLVLWNRLARLLQHIKWDSFLTIYQIDVAENDIAATALNASVTKIPDVYYMSPDRNNLIRYNATDERGDGVGTLREASEILEWLVYDLGDAFLGKDRIAQLLAELQLETVTPK